MGWVSRVLALARPKMKSKASFVVLEIADMAKSGANAPYGLGPMQAGMLFQSVLDEGTSAGGHDIEQVHISLDETLSVPELARAWTMVLRRHSALSSSFQWEGIQEPRQIENPDAVVPTVTEDLRGLDEPQFARRLEGFLARDRARGFDLRRAPVMRVTVFLGEGGRCDVVWTVHHILLDGRSMAPVLAEVFSAYESLRRGEAPRELSPPRPFRDFVDWLAARRTPSNVAFFKELLRGKTAPTPLPLSEPAARPLAREGMGTVVRRIEESVRRSALSLAERTGTTLGTVFLSAWALVLARLTGEPDVLFGNTRACRRAALDGEAFGMIGLLMNSVPVRVKVDEDGRVGELLQSVRAQGLAVRDHERSSRRSSCSTIGISIMRSATSTRDGKREGARSTSSRPRR